MRFHHNLQTKHRKIMIFDEKSGHLAFVDVKALGVDTKFSFQREQLRRSHAMAQAQLGFHWGLQLWLGFFDSQRLSPVTP